MTVLIMRGSHRGSRNRGRRKCLQIESNYVRG